MVYKTKRKTSFREVKEAFKEGWKEARDWEWKHAQLQTNFRYKAPKHVKIREFDSTSEARNFLQERNKAGEHIALDMEPIYFEGLACFGFKRVWVVYHSKKPFTLEASKRASIRTCKPYSPHSLSEARINPTT